VARMTDGSPRRLSLPLLTLLGNKRIMPIWPMFVCGVLMVVVALAAIYVGLSTKHWPTTTGKILVSDVLVRNYYGEPTTSKFYRPWIEYEYRVDGKTYRSKRLGNFLFFFGNEEFAKRMVARFTRDSEVKVYYHRRFRALAALIPDIQQTGWLALFLTVGIVISISVGQQIFLEHPLWCSLAYPCVGAR